MKPVRFFCIPNETREGDQVGPRKAFQLHSRFRCRTRRVMASYA
jgi:hypothetical protein